METRSCRLLHQFLAGSHRAPLARRAIGRFDEGHGLQVVVAGNLRFGSRLDGAHQLRHGADEGLREPALLPARLEPVVGSPLGEEVDRAGAPRRVVGPANGSLGNSLGPVDAPLDTMIGPGEGVVETDRAKLVRILQDIERNTVSVAEIEARVDTDADQNPLWITKE